ncbi:MAG: hypothetical protein V5789_14380 [Colwellia sp.]
MSTLKSKSYWIGHSISIIATIVGVYFAAIAGLNVAIKIEVISADRGTYYVSSSLQKELQFNVDNMDAYIEKGKGKPYIFKEHLAGIKLNNFIFQASKFSDSTFEIEPTLLSELSIYYFNVGSAIDYYYSSKMASPKSLYKIIKQESEKLNSQQTLINLARYNQALAKSIEDRGVSLSQPDY